MFEVYLYLLVSKLIANDFGLFLLNLHFLNMTCYCFILPFSMLWNGSYNWFHWSKQMYGMFTFWAEMVIFSKIVLGLRNFRYYLWGVGGDVWRRLCRHVRWTISAGVKGGWAEGLPCAEPEARTPIGSSGFFKIYKN